MAGIQGTYPRLEGHEVQKELGFDPGQWGAMEGGRLVEYAAGSVLNHNPSPTSASPRVPWESRENTDSDAAGLG